MAGGRKRTFRVIRADDEDDNNNLAVCQGRTVNLSADGRRTVTSQARSCARVDPADIGPSLWTNRFYPPEPTVKPVPKRRYANSDNNMASWVLDGRPQECLEEFVRLEAPGSAASTPCISCHDGLRDTAPNQGLFRCEDCWGTGMECLDCLLRIHKRNPLHAIQRWNGSFFEKVSLRALGLRAQLGHRGFHTCHNPQPASNDFTILHTNGIHKVAVDLCGCENRTSPRIQMLRNELFPATTRNPKTCVSFRLLEEHEMLSASGKLSIYEHYQALEKLTDNTSIDVPKRKYKSFFRVNRQFAHIKLLKRAGRGSLENGRETSEPGDLALPCPACPRPNINLPPDWKSAPTEDRFLYRPIFSLDANFRLKNLKRPSTMDPGLHTGLAYFVDTDSYMEYIAKHPRQKDISSCAGFKTLATAETKSTAGLRSTGVGMCTCARHEMILPNGVGDLQRGERYCNMDYIAMSAARHYHECDAMFYSYDISCQWCINLPSRMKELPEYLRLPDSIRLDFGVPKCHCRGHKLACQCEFSMNVQFGVGRTDGEGIERTWSILNNSAASTKEMLPGGRHDILDRRCGAHNWSKIVDIVRSLHRKHTSARDGFEIHFPAHQEFTGILPVVSTKQWESDVLAWEVDHARVNPYFVEAPNQISERGALQEMAEEEAKEALTKTPLHETTPSSCISLAMLIEDEQREIIYLSGCAEQDSPAVVKRIQDLRVIVREQLPQLRSLQHVYMPYITGRLAALVGSRDGDIEQEPLCLPSSLDGALRKRGCLEDLDTKEERIREGQCYTSLDVIRRMQRARRTITAFRHRNIRGTRATGRSYDVVKRCQALSDLAVLKYRAARGALLCLRGAGDWEKTLRPLEDADVKALDSYIFDIDLPKPKKKKTGMKVNDVQFGSGSYQIPWIWLMEGAVGTEDADELNDAIRVEWLKSRARALRWSEELRFLPVEKERVLLSFEHAASQWDGRTMGWEGLHEDVVAGVRALGLRQAAMWRRLAAHARETWATPHRPRRRRVPDNVDLRQEMRQAEQEEESDAEDEALAEAVDAAEVQDARELAGEPGGSEE